ncbi:MAG: serine/threonine protein kinase [Kofleriaceae bacterium]|nr:serine/threonine protein kinase [Kofleriaceae bacterium]
MTRPAANVESHIGQYKILRTLGAGGMGTVYEGEHILLGKRAAIKTLLPSLSSHREIVDRFFNEARAISVISDPGVVQIFDFGYHVDGTAYIVMELLEGEPLSTRIERLGKLPTIDALRITRQITSSLEAAHERGIIHRDLKPGNVYVIRDNEAQSGERTKILDFGVAKLGGTDEDAHTTQTGTMLGTPVYMSPEQCKSAGEVDHRTDIYSVGCALFHMLTGRPPFECDSVAEFIAAHLREEPEPPSTLVPDLHPHVDAIVMRCLAKAPEDRFQSMAELQAAIERALAEISDSGSVTAAPGVARLPLGEGFQSKYDVNLGNRLATFDVTPPPRSPESKSWFIDSMSVPPISDRYDVPKMGFGKRIALAGALLAGVAGGLFVTSLALSAENASAATVPAPTAPAATSPEELSLQERHTVRETVPPVPLEPIEEPVIEEPAPAPIVKETAKKPEKVKRPPRPHVMKRPQPRTLKRDHETPGEDLYDTR